MKLKSGLFTIAILCSVNQVMIAQHKTFFPASYVNINSVDQNNNTTALLKVTAIDTIKPASFLASCFTSNPTSNLVLYYADVKAPRDSGYVTGTNVYGDLEKAQVFLNTTTTTLTGCAVRIHRAYSSTVTTIGTRVKLYSCSGTTPTTTVLATSNLIPQNTITNNGLTVFTFSTPIVVSSNYVMSVLLPNHTGDSTSIFSTLTNCNSGQSLSWERASDNSWGSIHTNWNFSTTQNIDLAIFPLYQTSITTGISEVENKQEVIFDTENSMLFNKSIEQTFQIAIYDVTGKLTKKIILDPNKKIELSDLQNGMYLVHAISLN